MNLLLVAKLHPWSRPVNAVMRYAEAGRQLGHEVALFSEEPADLPQIPCTLDTKRFDFAVFVVHEADDFPDLPYLARLLDGVPKERRVVIDCSGRYNDTIRIEHDFNHLERLDGHQGWEWIEGFEAVSDTILQPTLRPVRPGVRSFLFHGYHPAAVARSYSSPAEAARVWSEDRAKPYGITYMGNNWQRWSQLRSLLEAIEPAIDRLGPVALNGWDWDKRPEWAIEHGLAGIDVDTEFLTRLDVETSMGLPFHQFVDFVSQGRFSPVFQRPLFNHLGLVTNRAFETFCADTIPLLFIPDDLVVALYGEQARVLAPGDHVAGHLEAAMKDPEPHWEAVLAARAHLEREHSFIRRLGQLVELLDGR